MMSMFMQIIMLISLFVAGGKTIMSIQIAGAQYIENNNTGTSLGNPFFLEKDRIIGQRVLSVDPLQIEFTVLANATINGNINATNTGTTISTQLN